MKPLFLCVTLLIHVLAHAPLGMAQDAAGTSPGWPRSLETASAEEGFALAIRLARKGVTETQTESAILHEQRPEYARDADSLIAASQVVAIHFQTIAAANDYWRD